MKILLTVITYKKCKKEINKIVKKEDIQKTLVKKYEKEALED